MQTPQQITIFSNGEIRSMEYTLQSDEFVIAADGGARHCFKFDIHPDVVIGDFDSLTTKEIDSLLVAGSNLIRHPADKDETDLELALDFALKIGAKNIVLLGRLMHSWINPFVPEVLVVPKYRRGFCFGRQGMFHRMISVSGKQNLAEVEGHGERNDASGGYLWERTGGVDGGDLPGAGESQTACVERSNGRRTANNDDDYRKLSRLSRRTRR